MGIVKKINCCKDPYFLISSISVFHGKKDERVFFAFFRGSLGSFLSKFSLFNLFSSPECLCELCKPSPSKLWSRAFLCCAQNLQWKEVFDRFLPKLLKNSHVFFIKTLRSLSHGKLDSGRAVGAASCHSHRAVTTRRSCSAFYRSWQS